MVGTELLYFADICAGPGGFSEYVLWRRKWHAKGFGLTLRGVLQVSYEGETVSCLFIRPQRWF